MNLLERYLQAIGQYLPEETRVDTLEELRANLLEQMDARAEELGQPLTEVEVGEVLRAHGKPEAVALRYLPQRSLIGPAVFPFYTLTLSRVLPIVVFVCLLARGIEWASSRGETVAHALGGFALGLFSSLLTTAALITAIFAVIEWSLERGKLGAQWMSWDPAKLPALKTHAAGAPSPRSVARRAMDLGLHCLWFAFVLWVPWHPFWILGPGVFYLDSLHVTLAPVWHTFYALLIGLLVIQLVAKLLAFVPAAERRLGMWKLTTDLLGLVAIGVLAWTTVYFVAADAAADLGQIALVNHWVNFAFRLALVLSAIGVAKDGWEYSKRWKGKVQLAF